MAVNFYIQKETDVLDIELAFSLRVSSVRGLNPPQPKELFTRDWAEEQGIDVYLPSERMSKSTKVTLTLFAEGHIPSDPMTRVESFCSYVFSDKVVYWDTNQKRKATLIYDSNNPIWVQYLEGNHKLMFEVTFINQTGLTEIVT